MFTGLIEELGKVKKIKKLGLNWQLAVEAAAVLDDLKAGDSIAVDGACLTVTEVNSSFFWVDASLETLESTYFKELKLGHLVNLERALKVGARLGGHFVLGHVDAVGKVKSLKKEKDFASLVVEFPLAIRKYLINKGSVAVNGVSLTIASIEGNKFKISLIPATLNNTNLSFLKKGDKVNIETDVLGKYVENFANLMGENLNLKPKASKFIKFLSEF